MNALDAKVVAVAASLFVGQSDSAGIVGPYVDIMPPSQLHLATTSGFSTISGSAIGAYIGLGVRTINFITVCMVSIPASITISKFRCPEVDEPITRGRVVVDRGDVDIKNRLTNDLHTFANGALSGFNVVGKTVHDGFTILTLVLFINNRPFAADAPALPALRLPPTRVSYG